MEKVKKGIKRVRTKLLGTRTTSSDSSNSDDTSSQSTIAHDDRESIQDILSESAEDIGLLWF